MAVRRLNQLLDEMRDVRDEFVNTYSLLQKRLDELETITTQFHENLMSSSSRSVHALDRIYSIESEFVCLYITGDKTRTEHGGETAAR